MLITKYQRIFTNEYQISTKDYVRNYKLFMQNKPNFRNEKMNINTIAIMRYVNLDTWRQHKNKANSKPIQTQFKANLCQNKPNSKPIKPKTNPIYCGCNQKKILIYDYCR